MKYTTHATGIENNGLAQRGDLLQGGHDLVGADHHEVIGGVRLPIVVVGQ